MGTVTKREYLQAIVPRYRQARRKGKQAILDEFCHLCGYNRKYAIRLLRRKPPHLRQRRGPRPRYSPNQIFGEIEGLSFSELVTSALSP
jgi:hypothetical protein